MHEKLDTEPKGVKMSSSETEGREVRCAKCGLPVTKDWAGYSHKVPAGTSMQDRRKYRHVIRIAA